MMGLGSSMAGGNPTDERQENDWYPTPRDVTEALLRFYKFTPQVHECACGDGSMSEVLKAHGYDVISTDLYDRGYGKRIDFFDIEYPYAPSIVTNPPFSLAPQFIEHALGVLKVDKLALLLKSTFWHAKSRLQLFEKYRPTLVGPLLWRPDFLGKGRPTMECSWVIWDKTHEGATHYVPISRPAS